MRVFDWLKGVFNRMFSSDNIQNVLKVQPAISSKMRESIELWELMYQDKAPWLSDNVKSLGLAGMIASEKARTATIEMEIKVTGESPKAEFMRNTFNTVRDTIRDNLEVGIALGSFVIKPYVHKGIDGKYVMDISYVKATDFYPIAFSANKKVTEAAFVDRAYRGNAVYNKVEYHKLTGTTLTVINKLFKQDSGVPGADGFIGTIGNEVPLSEIGEWANLEPIVTIENIDTLLFAYFKMPDANTIDLNSPLGVSGFSRAVGLIKDADEQYSNLLWEFEGGQLAIDVDRTALNPTYDKFGKPVEVLPKLQDRLYRRSLDLGDDNTYNVFSPNLRDVSILNGLNAILTRIEDVCAISRGTLSEQATTEARTATELRILKQRTYAANEDIQKALQSTFEDLDKVLSKYCELYDIVPDGDYAIAYKWDDSIMVDKDTERQVDLMDIDKGLMSKVEYRMKWFGETEEQAIEAVKKINDEKIELMTMQQEVMVQTQAAPGQQPPKDKETNPQQKENDSNKKANESGEVRNKNKTSNNN